MATLSHFSSLSSLYSRNCSFPELSQSPYQQSKLHWFSNRQFHNLRRRECSVCAASVKKSRVCKKTKSDAELCNEIREFIKSVGFPEDHVPSTKELLHHGRNDLANIVRRRGYKLLREILTNSTEKMEIACDTEDITLTGQDGKVEDVVEDLSSPNEALIVEDFFSSLNNNRASCSDDCNSAPIMTANSSVEEELFYDAEFNEENNESHKENDVNADKFEEDISLKTKVTAAESYFGCSKIGSNIKCNDYNGEATEFSPKLHSVEKSLHSLEHQSETINNKVDESSLSPSSTVGEDLNIGGLDDKHMPLTVVSFSEEVALYTHEHVEKEANNVDDISQSVNMTITDDHSSDLDVNHSLVHDESSYKSMKSSENSSLKEKVAKFIQSGDLDMIDDNFNVILSENDAGESNGFIGAEKAIDNHGEAHSEEVVSRGYNVISSDESASETGHITASTTIDHFVIRDDQPSTEAVSGQIDTKFRAERRGNENQVEIDRLKFMLHQKELELSQLKDQIEREKLALSDLQNKAETEISKAQKLIFEKDTELHAAEGSLSGLEEVQILYHGDGEIVEVAGSFNGWHHRIMMDPQPSSSNIVVSINSRKSRHWSAILWLYPGVYEIKFVVDGHWRIDPHRESVTKGGLCNNILQVEGNNVLRHNNEVPSIPDL